MIALTVNHCTLSPEIKLPQTHKINYDVSYSPSTLKIRMTVYGIFFMEIERSSTRTFQKRRTSYSECLILILYLYGHIDSGYFNIHIW